MFGAVISGLAIAVAALLFSVLIRHASEKLEQEISEGEFEDRDAVRESVEGFMSVRHVVALVISIALVVFLASGYSLVVSTLTNVISPESSTDQTTTLLLVACSSLYVLTGAVGLLVMYEGLRERVLQSLREVNVQGESRECSKEPECMEKLSVIEQRVTASYAATATCIPLRYDAGSGEVHALLVFNKAYSDKCWMFPGGHTLPKTGEAGDEAKPPQETAIAKCEQELGCSVEIVDLRDNFRDLQSNKVDNMQPMVPPHYSYLFSLDKRTGCYESKGHRYHYDSVYVGEYSRVDEDRILGDDRYRSSERYPYEAIVVKLPVHEVGQVDVEKRILDSISDYRRSHKIKDSRYQSVGDYPAAMLCAAHRDYVSHLKESGVIVQ